MRGLTGFQGLCDPLPHPHVSPASVLTAPDVPLTHLVLGFAVEGNAPPPKKITSWFLSKGQGKTRDDSADYIPHDIYVIGTQEDPLGEKEWLEILKHSLQEVTSMTFKTVSGGRGPRWDTWAVDLASWEHLGGKSVLSGPPAVQGQRGSPASND